MLLQNARLADDAPLQDLRLDGELIAAIAPSLAPAPGEVTHDLGGRLVMPGLVELHAHLDKAFSDTRNQSGTLNEAIMGWMRAKPGLTADGFRSRALRGIRDAIAHGVTALRTHIDIAPGDLRAAEVLLALREALRGVIDLQIVALGYQVAKGAAAATLREALAQGMDVIGGVPAMCPDPKVEIAALLDLAQESGRPLDLHIDEGESARVLTLELLADAILARGGIDVPVAAGHCVALAFAEPDRAKAVMAKVAEAGITVIALPMTNQVLLGRRTRPTPRATAPVKALLAAGVEVCAGTDNVQDMFNPFGDGDPLRAAQLTAMIGHLSGAAELQVATEMVCERAARLYHGAPRAVAVGQPADLVVVDAASRRDAITGVPPRLMTLKAGRIVYSARIERAWHLPEEAR